MKVEDIQGRSDNEGETERTKNELERKKRKNK